MILKPFSLFFFFVVLFGCSSSALFHTSYDLTNNKEDELIMQSYAALDENKLQAAKDFFYQAYKLTHNQRYIKEIIGIDVMMANHQEAKRAAQSYLDQVGFDEEVTQALIGILTTLKDFDAALQQANIALSHNPSQQNLEIISSVYFLKKDYSQAIAYLKKAYLKEYDEILLDKIASIYHLFLKDKKMAILQYQTHIKKHGFSDLIGKKLALLYLEDKHFKQAGELYEAMFAALKNQEYAHLALEVYFQSKDFASAQMFLERNPNIDQADEILLDLYRANKDYTNAIKLLQKLYSQNKNPDFLALEAMMQYESQTNKNDPLLLHEVTSKLYKVVLEVDDALYWNYLGYLMIDHNLNLNQGIEYVKKALKLEPDNIYYLDSLAWGYYKLDECSKAKATMQKIPKEEINKEEEIKAHYQKIMFCQ